MPIARNIELRTFAGARATRILDGSQACIQEHAHDWPVLSLYVMGSYRNITVMGERAISSPSAVLYAAQEAHANRIGEYGLEQIDIEFDPAWLKIERTLLSSPVRIWIGGTPAKVARQLCAAWAKPSSAEADLKLMMGLFLRSAVDVTAAGRAPSWLPAVVTKLNSDRPGTALDLAKELGMNPGWLGEAYKAATGEGLRETICRRRVERAACLLRGQYMSAAQIALETGFCDQSHMIRSFTKVAGRSPSQMLREWDFLQKQSG